MEQVTRSNDTANLVKADHSTIMVSVAPNLEITGVSVGLENSISTLIRVQENRFDSHGCLDRLYLHYLCRLLHVISFQ